MTTLPLNLPLVECQRSVDPKLQLAVSAIASQVQAHLQAALDPYVQADPHKRDVVDLLKCLGDWQPGEVWQETYALMYDVVFAHCKHKAMPDPEVFARDIVILIAEYLGNNNVYFPTIEPIRTFVRDSTIFALSGRIHPNALAQRFELTETWVYHVIQAQSALRRPHQGKLFQGAA